MKKIIVTIIMFLLCAGVVSASSVNGDYNGNPIVKVIVNGQEVESEVPAQIIDGSTMLPVRAISEAINANVKWDQESMTFYMQPPKSVNYLFDNLGPNGFGVILSATFTAFKDFTQISFVANFNTLDESNHAPYILLVASGAGSGAAQIRIEDTSDYITFIKTQNYLDYASGKLTYDDFLKTIEYVQKTQPESKPQPEQQTPTVQPDTRAIESTIDGDFEGWDGETIFKLSNGQIWQQDSFAFTYHYAFMPKVLIYKDGARYKMKVEGVKDTIYVKRLK